jgi:hypothetical protein
MNSRFFITSALVAALALGAVPAGAQVAPAERPAAPERAERPAAPERAERPQVERSQPERPQVERPQVERRQDQTTRSSQESSERVKRNPPAGSLLPYNPADGARATLEQKRDECLRQQDEASKNLAGRSIFSRLHAQRAPCRTII